MVGKIKKPNHRKLSYHIITVIQSDFSINVKLHYLNISALLLRGSDKSRFCKFMLGLFLKYFVPCKLSESPP